MDPNLKEPLSLKCIKFIKDVCLPNTLPATTTVLIALSVFSFIVPIPASAIIFKATIVVTSVYGASLILYFVTPYLPEKVQNYVGYIKPFFREFALMGLFATIYFKDLSKNNSKKIPLESDPLIIIICGYLHNSSGALELQYEIEKRTAIPVRCINPESLLESIDNHSKNLGSEIAKAEQEIGTRDIVLIGHSMGGIVSLVYAFKEGKSKVKDLITLSSPSKGTKIAHIGFGECAKEMRKDSNLIKEINENSKTDHGIRLLQIGLKNDLIVPLKSAFLDGVPQENTRTLNGMGHTEILLDKQAIDIVIDHIIANYPSRSTKI